MTSASILEDQIILKLSKAEALVFYEWLSRNWERTHWDDKEICHDPAEKQLLLWLESDLNKNLTEPFLENYKDIISGCYREIVANPEEW